MLLRLAYLGVTNALAMLRLLPMGDRAKDAEILAFRHQIMVLERQLHGEKQPGLELGEAVYGEGRVRPLGVEFQARSTQDGAWARSPRLVSRFATVRQSSGVSPVRSTNRKQPRSATNRPGSRVYSISTYTGSG